MTSMIDIVFLLLIFFVCASTGQVVESLLPTELASGSLEAATVEPVEQPLGEVWIHLIQTENQKTVAELNDRRYSDHAELQLTLTSLAELAPEIPVILEIDGTVPLGEMIKVYDTCRAANFESIHFATTPDYSKPQATNGN